VFLPGHSTVLQQDQKSYRQDYFSGSRPKGYDSKALRDAIIKQDAIAVIPPRKTSPQVHCDCALYCERNLIERFFLKLKHFRCIATRYEQTPRAFMSMLSIVSAHIWTR
jgi:transposase